MTRDEMLLELAVARKVFDDKVAAVPRDALSTPPAGFEHSVAEIVSHVTAYEQLVIERLVAARHGAGTALRRDRDGWEVFNEETWAAAAREKPESALARTREVFESLAHEVGQLSDEELNAAVGATAALDPAWLEKRSPWRSIAIDTFEHYPMHHAALDAAAGTTAGGPAGT